MRLALFFRLLLLSVFASLLFFALSPEASVLTRLKMVAAGAALAIAVSALYPEMRGVKSGDVVSVVMGSGVPALVGRFGRAMGQGKKNNQIKVKLDSGGEVIGIIESYEGVVSPPRIRLVYEEKLVD